MKLGAVAGLLGRSALQDPVVTGDAQFMQREVCQRVVVQGDIASFSRKATNAS